MRPSELAATLEHLVTIGMPTFVWGPPGLYKSSVVRQVAAKAGRPLLDVRAVLLDPVDLRGLPSLKDGRTTWNAPDFLPHDPAATTIIFLDELAQAPPLVQSACLQLVLDRRIGEYELPKGVALVAASNRVEDRAGAHRIITPLLNRFVHLEADIHKDDWQAWAIGASVDPRIRSFINWRPELLLKFDPKNASAKAFPTPRSWHMTSECIRAVGPHALMEVTKGCVGEAAAMEFTAFCETYGKLPDPADVLANPTTHEVYKEPSLLFALIGALTEHLKNNRQLGDAYLTYAARLSKEFSVVAVRDGGRIVPSMLHSAGGKKWLSDNAEVLNVA